MENIYAMMLLYHAGKEVTEEIVKDILEAAEVIWDGDQILRAVASFNNTDVSQILTTVPRPVITEEPEVEGIPEDRKKKVDEDDEEEPRGIGSLFGKND